MTIGAILEGKGSEVVSVACDTMLREAVELLADRRIGAMPVLKGAEVVGIISERDIIQCLKGNGADILDWEVERVMTAPAITVTRDVPVLVALSMMTRRRIRHLPVLEGGEVIGIVSIGDLVAHRIAHIEREAEAMRNYIQNA
jgi:CBS domain-containing protein